MVLLSLFYYNILLKLHHHASLFTHSHNPHQLQMSHYFTITTSLMRFYESIHSHSQLQLLQDLQVVELASCLTLVEDVLFISHCVVVRQLLVSFVTPVTILDFVVLSLNSFLLHHWYPSSSSTSTTPMHINSDYTFYITAPQHSINPSYPY